MNSISNVHVSIDESIQSTDVPILDSEENADVEIPEPELEQLPVKAPAAAPEVVYLHANQKPGRKPKFSRVLEPQEEVSISNDEAVIDSEATAVSEQIFAFNPVTEEIQETPILDKAAPEQSVVTPVLES